MKGIVWETASLLAVPRQTGRPPAQDAVFTLRESGAVVAVGTSYFFYGHFIAVICVCFSLPLLRGDTDTSVGAVVLPSVAVVVY